MNSKIVLNSFFVSVFYILLFLSFLDKWYIFMFNFSAILHDFYTDTL